MNENNIKTNSLKAWILAARPKTLTGAAVPVMLGTALAWHDAGASLQVIPVILCFLFALIMQIDANFVNDYFDFVKGSDNRETRLGPKRACAEGWITPFAMRIGMFVTTAIACMVGLPLIFWGGIDMIIVGLLCVAFCFLYTTRLSYLGLGDLLVFVFFGLIPVCLTYYLATGNGVTWEVVTTAIASGMVIDTMLIINNYRDRDNDRRDGKKTLAVRLGQERTENLYRDFGVLAAVLLLTVVFELMNSAHNENFMVCFIISLAFTIIYLVLHLKTWKTMKTINHGKELNRVLGLTSRNMVLFGLLQSLSIILTRLL